MPYLGYGLFILFRSATCLGDQSSLMAFLCNDYFKCNISRYLFFQLGHKCGQFFSLYDSVLKAYFVNNSSSVFMCLECVVL